jgi:hypothetical protein
MLPRESERVMKESKDDEMLKEYDFSKGVRGKYAEAYEEGGNIVVLEPEVLKEFPDSKSVDEALKHLIEIIKGHKIVKKF